MSNSLIEKWFRVSDQVTVSRFGCQRSCRETASAVVSKTLDLSASQNQSWVISLQQKTVIQSDSYASTSCPARHVAAHKIIKSDCLQRFTICTNNAILMYNLCGRSFAFFEHRFYSRGEEMIYDASGGFVASALIRKIVCSRAFSIERCVFCDFWRVDSAQICSDRTRFEQVHNRKEGWCSD